MSAVDRGLVVTVKTIHVFGGLYIWEWLTSLGYEWDVVTGRRKVAYWSFAVYTTTRTLALAIVILMFIGFNNTHYMNCEAWFRITLVFSYAAVACCALLIGLRAVALWGRTERILYWVGTIWLVDIGICVWNITRAHTTWVPAYKACGITSTQDFRNGLVINFVANFLLLGTMFTGVWRKRNSTQLWYVLFVQGIAWVLAAMLSEIPTLVLSWVNISDGWNLLFSTPHVMLFVIVCTRMHRDLSQYINGPITQRPAYLQSWPVPRRDPGGIPMHVSVHRTVHVTVDEGRGGMLSRNGLTSRGGILSNMSQIESLSPADAKDMAIVM